MKNNRIVNSKIFFNCLIATFILLLILGFTGCKNKESQNTVDTDSQKVFQKDVFAMDTYMNLKAYGENAEEAVNEAADYIYKLSSLLDVTLDSSEISQLNQYGRATVSPDTFDILEKAAYYSKITDGAFDPTVYGAVKAWGFTTKEHRVPPQEELDKLLPHIGYEKVVLNKKDSTVTFSDPEVWLDTGAITKGYVSQKIYDIFQREGIKSAIVSLGGNVLALGSKAGDKPWTVGVSDPKDPDKTIASISVKNKFVVTSGSYQRFFKENGHIYHHIIDPKTAKPADKNLTSVTIITDNGTAADALSTALFVKGKDDAIKFWKKSDIPFDIIFIDNKENISITQGITDIFSADNKDVEVIKK